LIVVIMPSKKAMKGAPKHGEKVNPTDNRPKIVVETITSPDVSVEEVTFDAVESPQAVATTATTATTYAEGAHEEVSVRFDPPQILTRAETTAARRFAAETGLMGSETAVPNLCGGQTEAETAVGTILGRGLGRFGSGGGESAGSTDPLAYGIFPPPEPKRW
jgi:hypothetical protein